MPPRSKGKMTSRTMPSGFSITASATRQNCISPSAGFTVTSDTLSLSIAKSDRKQLVALEEFVEERRRFIRDADDLVSCLTIEFEIELGSGLAVIPVGELFELAPPQRPLRERGASDGEAHTRCLPGDTALLRDRFGGSDNAARDEALPALVLAREHENLVAFGDMLSTIHRLLRRERERLRPRIANLGFDRERHASRLPPQMSTTVIPGRTLSFPKATAGQVQSLDSTGASAKVLADLLVRPDKAWMSEGIAQFGLGFISTYAIADTIEILSRPWQRDAVSIHVLLDSKCNYTIKQSDKSEEPGTSLVLHLNSDSEFLLDNDVLEEIVL
jgi:hypothetical protein